MLGRGGWGILGTVSGDVGSKRVIFHGSWGYVVRFWCRPVPETLPGCTLAGSWVAGWGAWGPRGSPGQEAPLVSLGRAETLQMSVPGTSGLENFKS